jgi:hypothetical protein
MQSLRAQLRVEELEARDVPSSLLTSSSVIAQKVHPLAGRGHGNFTTEQVVPDIGPSVHLAGTGTFAGLGRVTVWGDVRSLGFVFHGQAKGLLWFANHAGSVTVQVQGPAQTGIAPLPQNYHYTIVQGSGAYEHMADTGTLRLVLGMPTPAWNHMVPHSHGTFSLYI